MVIVRGHPSYRPAVAGGLAGWITWPKPDPMAKLEDTIEAPDRPDAFGREVRLLDEVCSPNGAPAACGNLAQAGKACACRARQPANRHGLQTGYPA
jgi:hypothetical protein